MKHNSNVIMHPRYLDNKKKISSEPANRGQKKKNKIIPIVGIFLFVVTILVVSAFGRFVWAGYQLDKEISFYSSQLEYAKIQNAQLLQDLEQIQDPLFVERMARERLGLVREGERIIIPTVPGDVRLFNPSTEGEIQN